MWWGQEQGGPGMMARGKESKRKIRASLVAQMVKNLAAMQ